MSVPGVTGPAVSPEPSSPSVPLVHAPVNPAHGRPGRLKLLGVAGIAAGVFALAIALAVQVIPDPPEAAQPGQAVPVAAAAQPVMAAAPVVSHTVTYELGGEGVAVRDITYVVQGAVLNQEPAGDTPWSRTVPWRGTGAPYFSITAQNTGDGTLTCRIVVDGRVATTNSTDGDHATVSCVS